MDARCTSLRRKLAFLLVGMADHLYPSPGLGVLSNAQLDTHLARRRRVKAQRRWPYLLTPRWATDSK